MRIIKLKTLEDYLEGYPRASKSIGIWKQTVEDSKWANHSELKLTYGSASIIDKKRVVFSIGGNKFRLVTDINYKAEIV